MVASAKERFLSYRGKGVVVDANLLIPLFLSEHLPNWRSHKKTSKNKFFPNDINVIKATIDHLGSLLTTPHVLTELSNQLEDWLSRSEILKFVLNSEECHSSANELVRDELFYLMGISDVGLLKISSCKIPLFSTDETLVNYAISRGGLAISLNEARDLYSEYHSIT